MKLYLNVVEVAIEHDEKFLIIKRPEGKMPLWISALLQALRDLMQPFLAYMLSKEQLKRKQAEENLELQESYEKLDEQNQSYHDRGKSGLLERLRKSRESPDK